MNAAERVARNLAAALLAGAWTRSDLLQRIEALLGGATREAQHALVDTLLEGVTTDYPPSPPWLTAFLVRSPDFQQAAAAQIKNPRSVQPVLQYPVFAPAPRFAALAVPELATPGDLAAWLALSIERLDWLSDARRQHASTGTPILQHYRYAFAPKRSGPPRLIEIPKPGLISAEQASRPK